MRQRSLALVAAFTLSAVAVACATLGTEGPESQSLPTSGVGPFRGLATGEELGLPPYVLDGLSSAAFQEPAVLPLGTDPTSMSVALYVDATVHGDGGTTGVIVRTRATDGVSFYGTTLDSPHQPERVLAPSAAWEGSSVHSPSVLRIGAKVAIYYAAEGGIGLAVSSDGLTFIKNQTPVLRPDPAARWETTTPTAPSVAIFPDRSFHMLYAAGVSIGEATSTDGYTWTRASAPILTPLSPSAKVTADASGEPFDLAQVTDPCLLPQVTPAGRLQVRVLYTGYAEPPGTVGRQSSIGFAARYGDTGALERSDSVVYSVGKHEAAPALFEWSGGSLLYVQQDSSAAPVYPEIAAAVAPATLTLPAPSPTAYPASP